MSRVAAGALQASIRAAEAAGIERTMRAGAGLGWAWHGVGGPRTRRVRNQLAASFPDRSRSERDEIAAAVFSNLGRGLAEALLLLGRHRGELLDRMKIVGREHLAPPSGGDEDPPAGCVLVGAHLGNWELAAAKLAATGLPVSVVYRRPRQPMLALALERLRGADSAAPPELIPMGPRAGIHFIRALEAGRHVLVVLDQRAGRSEGVDVEFFGRPAVTRVAPIKLADRVGARIVYAFPRRDPDGIHHTLSLRPALQLEPGATDDESVLKRNLQCISAEIEQEIRASPGQWIWTHRRWRTRTPTTPG